MVVCVSSSEVEEDEDADDDDDEQETSVEEPAGVFFEKNSQNTSYYRYNYLLTLHYECILYKHIL